mgnify:CR=1 FL=1
MSIGVVGLISIVELNFVSDISCPSRRCHVMEVESFENEEIAKSMNDWFVSIKVRSYGMFAMMLITLFSRMSKISLLFTSVSFFRLTVKKGQMWIRLVYLLTEVV